MHGRVPGVVFDPARGMVVPVHKVDYWVRALSGQERVPRDQCCTDGILDFLIGCVHTDPKVTDHPHYRESGAITIREARYRRQVRERDLARH